MRVVDDTIETIHLYVVREEEKRPYTLLPLLCAFLCLFGIVAVTMYSGQHPYYEHERLVVAPRLLPLKVFTATAPITPTGVRIVAPTYAHGVLSVRNGSIIGQNVPAGFIISGVVTESTVYVPGATADGDGYATIPAHVLTPGINLSANTVSVVIGTSLFVRNPQPFTGGRPAYSVKFVTSQDKQTALLQARGILLSKSSGLHYPCIERFAPERNILVTLTWRCQFVRYTVPSYMHVTAVRLSGKNLIIDVLFVPRPTHVWVK